MYTGGCLVHVQGYRKEPNIPNRDVKVECVYGKVVKFNLVSLFRKKELAVYYKILRLKGKSGV